MKMPRLWHRLIAFVFKYQWHRCPMCGKGFGGHEDKGWLYTGKGRMGRFTCAGCKEEARILGASLRMYEDENDITRV